MMEISNNGNGWSGRGDSNPRLQLGKLPYYPYTTAAFRWKIYNTLSRMSQGIARITSTARLEFETLS